MNITANVFFPVPAEDVRLLQPVSFHLSNLEQTKEQIRAQKDRYECYECYD